MTQRKHKLGLILLALLLFLSACGLNSHESLQVDDRFQGQRIISLELDRAKLSYLDGGVSAFSQLLREHIQDPLSYQVITETKDQLEIKIYLSFNSLSDYISKARALYKRGNQIDDIFVTFIAGQHTSYYEGLEFKDNIEAKKLLAYLVNQAVEDGIVSESNKDKIWNKHSFELVVNNEKVIENASQPPYEIKTLNYIGPSKMQVFTFPKNKQEFIRIFSLSFPSDQANKLADDWPVKFFGQGARLANGKKASFVKQGLSVFDVIIEGSPDNLLLATQNFFGQGSYLSLSLIENTNDFSLDFKVKESIPPFLEENIEIDFHYLAQTVDINEFLAKDMEGRFASFGEKVESASIDEVNQGISISLQTTPIFEKIDIETSIDKDLGLTRSLHLRLSQAQLDSMTEDLLVSFLEKNSIPYEKLTTGVQISYAGSVFDAINGKLFSQQPQISKKEDGPFNYRLTFDEDSRLQFFEAEEITYKLETDKSLSLNHQSVSSRDQLIQARYEFSVSAKQNQYMAMGLVILLLLGLSLAAFLISRVYKKRSKNIKEKDKIKAMPTLKEDKKDDTSLSENEDAIKKDKD